MSGEQETALEAMRAHFPESAAFHSTYDLLRCPHPALPQCIAVGACSLSGDAPSDVLLCLLHRLPTSLL